MGWIDWSLSILTILIGIILIVIVIMQDSKSSQSSITGSNTFYGSNKSKTLDGVLSKYTVIISLTFIVLCFVTTLAILH
ncbi:preprotein translocase subunit SecG [compost metagenome]